MSWANEGEYKSEQLSLLSVNDGGEKVEMDGRNKTPAECCNSRCVQCTGRPCYRFKSTKDAVFCTSLTVMLTALFCAVVGPLVINKFLQEGIKSTVVIDSANAASYDKWHDNVGPDGAKAYLDTYFFDVQNPEGILNGEKPVVVEKGPYVYDEKFVNLDVEFSDDGDTVTFNKWKYFVFNKELSGEGLSETDQITIPYSAVIGMNMFFGSVPAPMQAMAKTFVLAKLFETYHKFNGELSSAMEQVNKWQPLTDEGKKAKAKMVTEIFNAEKETEDVYDETKSFVQDNNLLDFMFKMLMCMSPSGISPFWKTNPNDAYFGYLNDPVLTEVKMILEIVKMEMGISMPWSAAVPGALTNYTSAAEARRGHAPDVMKTGKKDTNQIGQYVISANMSSEFVCTSPTKSQNMSAYVEGKQFPRCEVFQHDWTIAEANLKGYTQPFGSPYANRISGGNGEQYKMNFYDDSMEMFIADIYRSGFIQYEEDVNDLYDLKLRRYVLPAYQMENATQDPDNAQYYSFCPSGMLNLTGAVNSPGFVSKGHFLDADPALVDAVIGLSPNRTLHDTYLDVEPNTGALARAHKVLQLNWEIKSKKFPAMAPDFPAEANALCKNISVLVTDLHAYGFGKNLTVPQCDNPLVEMVMTCAAKPAAWNIQNDRIFFPTSWANENMIMSEDDANSIKTSVYGTQDFMRALAFWGFIVAGVAAAVNLVMVMTVYNKAFTSCCKKSEYSKFNAFNRYKNNPEGSTSAPLLSLDEQEEGRA